MSILLKDLPKEDLPRERLLLRGVETLSNEEILAILLGTGTKNTSSKELASSILSRYESISDMKYEKLESLMQVKGMGLAKCSSILASIELGRRIFKEKNILNKLQIKNSVDIYHNFAHIIEEQLQENFLVVYLNNNNEYITHKILFKGTINKSIVSPREVLKEALLLNSSKIILMHNHPSGNIEPSKSDDEITRVIVNASTVFDIQVLDHIIVGKGDYYSYYENERIKYK